MDPSQPHWRINSSFSPPQSTDDRFHSDVLLNAPHGCPFYGSVPSSYSKGSRSRVSSDQHPNHYHSLSDGVHSYFGSPPENFQVPRSAPPLQRFDLGEFSTPAGGAKPEASLLSDSAERCFAAGVSSVSNSFGSASPLSESGQLGSTSKQPILFPPRNFSGRRSFMSKSVYPLVFRNPVSNSEACGSAGTCSNSQLTPTETNKSPSMWPENVSSPELKFHMTLSELQKMDASPGARISSRREGFRWSNASSYDFGFEGDSIDISEPACLEGLRSACNTLDQRCGLCGKLLWQKSPWSLNSDMPITGVLPCSHVFHAKCLEETTPKSHIDEPPCPLCSKEVKIEGSMSYSEPLQMALRSARRSQGVKIASFDARNCGAASSGQKDGDLKRNRSMPMLHGGGASLIKNHLKKHFSFKGKSGKDLFGAKVFGKRDPSSSSSFRPNKKQVGRSRIGQSSK